MEVYYRRQCKLACPASRSVVFDGHLRRVDAQHVEIIVLSAQACRQSGSRLDEQHPPVSFRQQGGFGAPGMKMAGQNNIGPASGQGRHAGCRASHRGFLHFGWLNEGMVRDYDARAPVSSRGKGRARAFDRARADPPALPIERTYRVEANDGQPLVRKARLEVRPDPPPVTGIGCEQPHSDPIERNIVVTRHHDARCLYAIEKGACFLKLCVTCALCQIPGNGNEVGSRLVYEGNQGIDEIVPDATEMQVGEVDDLTQERAAGRPGQGRAIGSGAPGTERATLCARAPRRARGNAALDVLRSRYRSRTAI